MAGLPPPTAPHIGLSSRVRLGRDYYVRVAGNDYSVHPSVIGRFVDITADLQQVRIQCGEVTVATTLAAGPTTSPSPTLSTCGQPKNCAATTAAKTSPTGPETPPASAPTPPTATRYRSGRYQTTTTCSGVHFATPPSGAQPPTPVHYR